MLANRLKATQFLRENQWDLESAAHHYFSANDDESEQDTQATPAPTGPRTLGGAPIPQPIPSTSSAHPPTSQPSQPKKKFATLGDLSKSGQSGHGHDDDDDDDDDDENHDLFAGGEKSALAVQNPDDLRRKLLEKARKYGQHKSY